MNGINKKKISLFLTILISIFFLFTSNSVKAAGEFIITVDTTKTETGSSDSTSFVIPTTGSGYNYTVNWGDGNTDTGVTGNATHDYGVGNGGEKTITISGSFPRIYFHATGDKKKILSVEQWGNISWTSMRDAFNGCSNLQINATDVPNLENVTSMASMFASASSMNSSNLSSWHVDSVTNMGAMFQSATSFNQNIGDWNVSNVTSMNSMFKLATSFNQNIGSWDVSSLTDTTSMFMFAYKFEQDLGNWDVSSATTMTNMFYGITLDTANYDALLLGWGRSLSLKSGVTFSGGDSEYCNNTAHDFLTGAPNSWSITDAGLAFSCGPLTKSNYVPTNNSVISDSTPLISFDLNKNGNCRASLSDESYADMADNIDCAGDGTSLHSCTITDLGANGAKKIYVACTDGVETDTTETNVELTYTLNTSTAARIYHIGNSLTEDALPSSIKTQLGISESGKHIACSQGLTYIGITNPDYTCVSPPDPYGDWQNALGNYDWDAVTMQIEGKSDTTGNTDRSAIIEFINKTTLDGSGNRTRNLNTNFFIYLAWPTRSSSTALSDLILNTSYAGGSSPPYDSTAYLYWLHDQIQSYFSTLNIRIVPAGIVIANIDQELRVSPLNTGSSTLSSANDMYRDDVHLLSVPATYERKRGQEPF